MGEIAVTGPVRVRLRLANGQTLTVMAAEASLIFDGPASGTAPATEPRRPPPILTWATAPRPEDAPGDEPGAALPMPAAG